MYLHIHTFKVNAQNSERKIKKIGVKSNSKLTTRITITSRYTRFFQSTPTSCVFIIGQICNLIKL